MPGPLADLVGKLMMSRDGVLPAMQAFPPLDLEQIAAELQIDERARDGARKGQPTTDSTLPDLVELDIVGEIDRRARKAGEEYRSQRDLYEGRIRRALTKTDEAVGVEAAGESAITDFKIHAIDDLNHLHVAQKEVEGRQQEFEDFRERNSLRRLPLVTSPQERLLRVLLLVLAVLGESTLNGLFFAKGSESGLIGGVVQALIFSVLNIGVAVFVAVYGLPWLRHRSAALNALGGAALLFYVSWVAFINLIIAHFRDLYVRQGAEAGAVEVWAKFAETPFVLADTQSWLLAALGIALSILSFIDAMGFDDPYPGFGAVGRRLQDAIHQYTDDKARCLAALTRLRNGAIAELQRVIELMRTAEYDLSLAVDGRTRCHSNFCAYLAHLRDAHQRLMRRYQEANITARQSPPPARFLARPEALLILETPSLDALPDLRRDTRERIIERTGHFIRSINRQFEEEVSKYQTVTRLTAPEGQQLVSK